MAATQATELLLMDMGRLLMVAMEPHPLVVPLLTLTDLLRLVNLPRVHLPPVNPQLLRLPLANLHLVLPLVNLQLDNRLPGAILPRVITLLQAMVATLAMVPLVSQPILVILLNKVLTLLMAVSRDSKFTFQ